MRKSRISSGKQAKLMEHFVAGTTARTAARLVRVNKASAAYYYHRLRELIYQVLADTASLVGEVEVNESYFGGHRKGKHGRGAAGKVPVPGRPVKTTSMALRTSGTRPSATCGNLTVFPRLIYRYS